MKIRTAVLLGMLALPRPVTAQQPELDPLLKWMDGIAQKQLDERDKTIAAITTTAQAEQRKQYVRAKLLEILGGLPEYDGPLHARVTGELKTENYTIEKVIFESLPGYFVTANLYRPNQPGRYPAVLLSAGHYQSGKTESQRIAANLASKGFVALAYDPVGQGERAQTYESRLKGFLAGWSTNEHIQAGAQCLMIGTSVARYFIWDAKRALDYLASRPEVDIDRLGCAGCSGGGTLTTYIGALDPRIKVAAPACYINSFRLLFTGPTPDNEMSLPRFLSSGLDMADFVELQTPAPWLILATEGDFFTPPAARIVFEEARKWFRVYGAEEKVDYFVGLGPHGTPLESRERLYEWMIRWLKNGEGDWREQPVPLYPDHDLLVTKSGQVETEPGSRYLYQLIREDFEKRKRQGTIDELHAELGRTLGPAAEKPAPLTIAKEEELEGVLTKQIEYEVEPGLTIKGTLHAPLRSGRKPAVLLVPGSKSIAGKMAAAGRIVLEWEPRTAPKGDDKRPFLGDWVSNTRAHLIGKPLAVLRARDILRGIDVLAARDDVDPQSIRAVGQGVAGIWLLLAAAHDPRVGHVWLDRTPYSMRLALDSPMNTRLHDAVIPEFVLHWDLEDLVKALGNRRLLWSDPTNWMNRVVPVGDKYRYRYLEEPDDGLIQEFLR